MENEDNASQVVLVLAGSMGTGWEDPSVGRRMASKLVGHELQQWRRYRDSIGHLSPTAVNLTMPPRAVDKVRREDNKRLLTAEKT